MPGFYETDADNIKALSEIATKNDAGQWVAGPDAPGYDKGQYIPTREITRADGSKEIRPGDNVGRSYTNRQRNNLVRANMRRQDMSEGEAREYVNEKIDQIEEATEQGDTDRIRDLRQQLHGTP